MQIHHLPQDIFPEQTGKAKRIIFHHYLARMGSFKGKSIMHTNAISMVISGEKIMHFADKSVHIKDDEFHFLSAGNCLASMELSKQKYFQSILIFFDNSVLQDFYIKYAAVVNKVTHNGVHSPYLSFKKDAFVLLLHYQEKPSEVYYKVGYENHSSFSQSFKQIFGLTPKDFQSQNLTVLQ
jgi:hypothetical protein